MRTAQAQRLLDIRTTRGPYTGRVQGLLPSFLAKPLPQGITQGTRLWAERLWQAHLIPLQAPASRLEDGVQALGVCGWRFLEERLDLRHFLEDLGVSGDERRQVVFRVGHAQNVDHLQAHVNANLGVKRGRGEAFVTVSLYFRVPEVA